MGRNLPTKKRTKKDNVIAQNQTDQSLDPLTVRRGVGAYEPKKFEKVAEVALLPKWEMRVYTICIIGVFVTTCYHMYEYSKVFLLNSSHNYYLVKGWSIFGEQYKDWSDTEFTLTSHIFVRNLSVCLCHSVVSLLTSRFAYKYRRHAWLMMGMCSVYYMLGWKCVAFVVAIAAGLFCVSSTGSVLVTWIVGFSFLVALNVKETEYLKYITGDMNSERGFILYLSLFVSTALLLLRLISFSIEKTRRVNGSSELDSEITFSLFDMLVYAFYVPFYYLGPVHIYKYYQKEVIKAPRTWSINEVIYITQKAVRSLLWYFVCETFLHFVYIHSFNMSVETLRLIPLWCVGGVLLFVSCFYQAVYVLNFGLAGSFMLVDNVEPPSNPRCCVRVAYFSDYWRFFDPGLHSFFRNYVYIPLGGSRHGLPRKILATFLTFVFVSFWHGADKSKITWAMVNCFAIFVEMSFKHMVVQPEIVQFECRFLSPAMRRRLHALLNIPLFIVSIYAIMVFYSDTDRGWVFLDRLLLNGTVGSIFFSCLQMYTITLFSQEVERWEQKRIWKLKNA